MTICEPCQWQTADITGFFFKFTISMISHAALTRSPRPWNTSGQIIRIWSQCDTKLSPGSWLSTWENPLNQTVWLSWLFGYVPWKAETSMIPLEAAQWNCSSSRPTFWISIQLHCPWLMFWRACLKSKWEMTQITLRVFRISLGMTVIMTECPICKSCSKESNNFQPPSKDRLQMSQSPGWSYVNSGEISRFLWVLIFPAAMYLKKNQSKSVLV